MRTPIPEDRAHTALTKLGMKHEQSVRVSGERYGNGTFHAYSMPVGYSTSRYDLGAPPNKLRKRSIAAVVRHFQSLGYTHVAAKGRQGIHWFSKRGPHDTEPGLSAKVGARLDTAHGNLWLSIHDYRRKESDNVGGSASN